MKPKFLPTLFLIAAVFLAGLVPAEAKRLALKPVKPVVIGSVRYTAPDDFMGFVVATDIPSHTELWRRRIYRVVVYPILERDVQAVFITSLAKQDHSLLITDERGRLFTLDLGTKSVRRRK